MIDEGTTAPEFELPAVVDGDHRRVALSEYVGEEVVILAFYPAAFNPGCDVESDLDQLDLFTMQPDVSVLAVGPDTLYANEAFAAEYDLHIPLLSDTMLDVAAEYGVAYEDGIGQHLIARAVFVIDHDGEIVYAWSSKDPASLANVDAIKDALGETGGDETALSRYRVGHAHYVEARRAFTSAMDAFSTSDWMMAQSDFKRARDEFEEAEQHFTSAVRFVDDDVQEAHYDAAKAKSAKLWQAADWLGRSASEFSSGSGAAGEELRSDAQRPLENARTFPEPIDPDDWPPEEPPERTELEDDRPAFLVDDEDEEPAALDVDLDEDDLEAGASGSDGDGTGMADAPADGLGADTPSDGEGATAAGRGDSAGADAEEDIDDDELAEIEAEIAASGPDEPLDDGSPEEHSSVVDEPPDERDTTDDAGAHEPDLDDLEDDLGGGGGSRSLEPEPDRDGAASGGAVDEKTAPADDAASEDGGAGDGEDELEDLSPESTSLEGIPSEEELKDEDDAAEDGS